MELDSNERYLISWWENETVLRCTYVRNIGVQYRGNSPYSLVLFKKGGLYILDRDGNSAKIISNGHKGEGPYQIFVTNDGELYTCDKNWFPLYHSGGLLIALR